MESIINKPSIPRYNPKHNPRQNPKDNPMQEPYIPHPLPRIGQPEE